MYDTINFALFKDKTPELATVKLLDYVPQFLDKTSHHYFNEGRSISITGYLNNLKVIVSENAIKVKDNSLCKWYLGDNIQTLSRGDCQKAIESLSDCLHLPMSKSDVTTIHLAGNLLVNQDPSLYYDGLGALNYFNRGILGNGLYYFGSNGNLVFYDKLKDAKVKGSPIPSLYDGKNLLRYERRFNTRLCKQFNCLELKAYTLYNENFYISIIDRWVSDYHCINKLKKLKKIDYEMVKTRTDLYNQTLLLYIESRGGLLVVLDELKQAQQAGELTKKQAQDLRNKYKEVANHKLFVEDSDLILELDQKVKQVQKHYR